MSAVRISMESECGHGETVVILDLADAELAVARKIAAAITAEAASNCQPRMEIREWGP